MDNSLNMAMGGMMFVVVALLILVVVIYFVLAIILNKLNKLMYGKGTALAWIPICNIYLLGKLTVNKIVGWALVICLFLTSTITTNVNGVENTINILPSGANNIVSSVYSVVVFGLFIYAIVKYIKLKKGNNVSSSVVSASDTMVEQVPVTPEVVSTQANDAGAVPEPTVIQDPTPVEEPQIEPTVKEEVVVENTPSVGEVNAENLFEEMPEVSAPEAAPTVEVEPTPEIGSIPEPVVKKENTEAISNTTTNLEKNSMTDSIFNSLPTEKTDTNNQS